jgi:hypothetical protein
MKKGKRKKEKGKRKKADGPRRGQQTAGSVSCRPERCELRRAVPDRRRPELHAGPAVS